MNVQHIHRLAWLTASAMATILVAQPALAAPKPETGSTAELIAAADIPYEQFTLSNGLRVVVHTDRKTPLITIRTGYHVGSKDEPPGRTGFAHLFEHLMFEGSEHVKDLVTPLEKSGVIIRPIEEAGAGAMNGDTWFDRTNYHMTVPTPALETALFIESDRMGHLLGAIDQEHLDQQRGVVQNEKREGENAPFGRVRQAILEGLFPVGHGYRHATIGSMTDLDAASLKDVKEWFQTWNGPNNAVLVLAGDIDTATARPLVEKYFGDIPPGPPVRRIAAWVPERNETIREVMQDQVGAARLYRAWAIPERTNPQTPLLDLAAGVLAGGPGSRFYNDLVRDRKLATAVRGSVEAYEAVSILQLEVDVAAGADPAAVTARIDELLTAFLAAEPSSDEVGRAASRTLGASLRNLEQIGGFTGKASMLANAALNANDPGFFKTEMQRYAAATPTTVNSAAKRWMKNGSYQLTVLPYGSPQAAPTGVDRQKMPQAGAPVSFDFPDVQRATLSSGVPVVFAHRPGVPVTQIWVSFDAGIAADSREKPGTSGLMLSLLDEGTTKRSSSEIVQEADRLGAVVGTSQDLDATRITIATPAANLAASVDLLGDIVRNPAFAAADVAQARALSIAAIRGEFDDPSQLALRLLPATLFGPDHPYSVPFTGSGEIKGVEAASEADLRAFHAKWIRPDNATIFIGGDTDLATVMPLLEKAFGDWKPSSAPKGSKSFTMSPPPAARIVLVDRPGSPQSFILGGTALAVRGRDDPLALWVANDLLGGTFLSRLNTNLRETKGWSYGAFSSLRPAAEQIPYVVMAPVQTDKTAASIKEIITELNAFRGAKGVSPDELARTTKSNALGLPGSFETTAAVLSALERNKLYGRKDDYQESLPGRFSALSAAGLNTAATKYLDPAHLVWVVVGDRAKIEAELKALNLPIEFIR